MIEVDKKKELLAKIAYVYPQTVLGENYTVGALGEFVSDDEMEEFAYEVLGICGCTHPKEALRVYKGALEWANEDMEHRLTQPFEDDKLSLIVLYVLGDKKLTEHGGSIYGSRLTTKGIVLLDAMNELELFDN